MADPCIISSVEFGLMNFENKYLTAEKFGNQINVTANALRSKQMWTFEKINESSQGYLKNYQDKYLQTDKNGVVTCTATEKKSDLLFNVESTDDGRWAFKDSFGKYLAGNNERLFTTFKNDEQSSWSVHFKIHPQCNIKNLSRKRYVSLYGKELHANEDMPWGSEAVITLSFKEGKYAILDCLGRYLNGKTGELITEFEEQQCLFNLSMQSHGFAFRCRNQKYLTIHGPQGKLIATKDSITKDEIFCIEERKFQVILTAHNGKMASTKQSIDVKANQCTKVAPVGDTEMFQLNYLDNQSNRVMLSTRNNQYWEATDKSIIASSPVKNDKCVFEMENHMGKIGLKASNGKYIASSSGGTLTPTNEDIGDIALFTLQIANNAKVMLRGVHGFLGAANGKKLHCNLGNGENLNLQFNNGVYQIKTNDLHAKVDSTDLSLVTTIGSDGSYFIIELCKKNTLQIKVPNGQYLIGNQNGTVTADGERENSNTFWEY